MKEVFSRVREDRSRGSAAGLCSVCSSHALVIEAAVRLAGRTKKPLLIEATANQVNQHGGYSGLPPMPSLTLCIGSARRTQWTPGWYWSEGITLVPIPGAACLRSLQCSRLSAWSATSSAREP